MIDIRSARIEDAADLVAIYAPYVEKTAITFETEVPTVEAFASRIEKTLEKFPYLVSVEEGKVVGYAYASTYYAVRLTIGRWNYPYISSKKHVEKESEVFYMMP